MEYDQISNGETGISVRTKINNLLDRTNFNMHYTSVYSGSIVTIPEGFSSVVSGSFIVEGQLIINGTITIL